ncbi:uncharacterized protein TNCV_4208581 [Trichonephila clavipes]|nr:uncharacterized protein TNCV_4208581 [Trichonephila clavipes]
MSEEGLAECILARLEPQMQDCVEVRNPSTRAQLLQLISKFEERYVFRETQGSSKNYNRDRRDWDMRRRSSDYHRNRNWKNTEVLVLQNDRSNNYRIT